MTIFCLLLLLLLSINQQLSVINAFEVGTTDLGTTTVSFGSSIDVTGTRFFTTGIDISKGCYISVGRVIGFDRKVFESPPMCLDVYAIKNKSTTGDTNGIITAMDDKNEQAFLYEFQYVNYQIQIKDSSFNLPNGYFPAVMITDNRYQVNDNDNEGNSVYGALHPTNGVINNNNGIISLKSTRDYLQHFTHPKYTTTTDDEDDAYSPIVYKYNTVTREQEWQLKFETQEGKTLITGMGLVPNNNKLVVFGSTTGYGMTVGAGAKTNGQYWNGFMTWVDLNKGTIDLSNFSSETHNSHGTTIRSQRNQNDYVLGVCIEDDKAYVVGSTTGKFEGTTGGGGFVLKIDTDRFDPTWKRQFVGASIQFTHCVVYGDSVMVGGISSEKLSARNGNDAYTEGDTTDDIVIVKLDKGSGETQFIRQIDSHRDDELVSMELHPKKNGDVYLTANAWEDDNDKDTTTNNLYILSIDQQGNHDWLNIKPTVDPITGVDSAATTNDNANDPMNDNANNPINDNANDPINNDRNSGSNSNSSSTSARREIDNTTIAVAIVAVSLVLLLILVVIVRQRKRITKEATTQNEEEVGDDLDDVESLASENRLQ